ncbi:hypothetical protein L6R53_06010 [Myxococcota bacterium]|nr:hypothetical protein [Myxococcota bacterium]
MRSPLPLALALPLALVACQEKGSGITVGGSGAVEGCTLTLDGLKDSQWVMLKTMPDKTEVPDHRTRMKFIEEGGQTKVMYNVGSLSDVYTYGCTKSGDELTCREVARPRDWCQALLVGGGECTAEVLKGYDPTMTDEEVAKAIEEANANVTKYKGGADWKQFELNNNNLGNKLQGLLYIKVDDRKCRLRITDNYMTIYNGKKVEDSNPVGTNPFVKHEGGELLWEHCKDGGDVATLASPDYPTDLANVPVIREAALGQEVHFHYLGQDGRAPVEGCEYSYDLWFDGTAPQRGLKPETVDVGGKPELRWHWAHTWSEPNKDGTPLAGTTTIHRKWTCADATKSGEEVSCAALVIR